LEVTDGKIKVIKRAKVQERNYKSEITVLLSTMKRLNIKSDEHVAIKRYMPTEDLTGKSSKKRATFYIQEDTELGKTPK